MLMKDDGIVFIRHIVKQVTPEHRKTKRGTVIE